MTAAFVRRRHRLRLMWTVAAARPHSYQRCVWGPEHVGGARRPSLTRRRASSTPRPPPKKPPFDENGVRVLREDRLRDGAVLACSVGSVVAFDGSAIVNAANAGCQTGGGVDGAVTAAGGETLRRARAALPVVAAPDVRCPVGGAVATVGGDLQARWCVHAVGPSYGDYDDLREADAALASAYRAALDRAADLRDPRASTLAFALLSAGIFRGPRADAAEWKTATPPHDCYVGEPSVFDVCLYPRQEDWCRRRRSSRWGHRENLATSRRSLHAVLRIAVRAIADYGGYAGLRKVHLVAFTDAERAALLDAAANVLDGGDGA